MRLPFGAQRSKPRRRAMLGGRGDAGHKPSWNDGGEAASEGRDQVRTMSDLRLNSIMGAVLGSVLGALVIGIGADAVIEPDYPEKAGFLPEVSAEATSGGAAEAPAGPPDFGRLFSDPAQLSELVTRGERVSAQCASCHTFGAGEPNRLGPNLHNVFGSNAGSAAGFEYSEGMRAHGPWDYLSLNEFLTSPARVVPGTKMAFAGLRNETDRVAMIAYLRSLSPNSVPLPAPLPEAAQVEEPAEDASASPAAPG